MSPGNGRALTALTHSPASTAAAMNAHEAMGRCDTSALGVVRPFWASAEADTYIHTYIHSGLTGLRHARAPHFPDSRLDEPVIGKAKGGCRPQIQSGQSVALNPRAPDGPRPTAHTPVLQ